MSRAPEACPKVSVVVIVHAMRRQAMNTLHSLSVGYQQGVGPEDYEVVVVENRSADTLDPAEVEALPGTFRYLLRDEPGVSPAAAINAGLALARGGVVGLMIDGARLVTPGVLSLVLMAGRIDAGAVVAVPGYQIGPTMQHLDPAHGEDTDRALLAQAGWPASGYGVFRVSSISWANRSGWLRPFMECNCLFVPRDILRDGGDADERFDLPGGGALNLHVWRRAALHPRARLVVLPGEGSFHQVHGGVTTAARPDREAVLEAIRRQLDEVGGEPFAAPDVAPLLLGEVPPDAAPFLAFSAERFGRWSRKARGPHLVEASFESPRRLGPEGRAERGPGPDAARPDQGPDQDRPDPTPPSPTPSTSAPSGPARPGPIRPEAAPPARPDATRAAPPEEDPPVTALPSVYLPPSLRGFKPLHTPFSTWAHHQPFGYDLAAALRPRLLVELGTQAGLSYFTFCQAMKEHGVDGLAYAVDTWQGDEHTKGYDDEVYQAVAKHNRQYGGFSYLMRMLFQDALRHFTDGTIDLLHVDGLHTYEAVSEDFRLWGPKVRPGGLVLFHDVRARLLDFGAWRFWDELEREHETFAFNHGFGLGVLRMPGGDRSGDPPLVRLLFEGSRADGGEALRAFYVHAVRVHELSRQAERAQAKKAERAAQAEQAAPGGPRGESPGALAAGLVPPQA